jgi:hypothetical protein
MPVAVYKLRIRERAGDDSEWHEARVVAASLAEALTQAQQRFGDELVLAIEQDHAAADVAPEPIETEGPAAAEVLAQAVHVAPVEPVHVEVLHARHGFATATATGPMEAEPMPWEGRWRPSVLIWIGVFAGLVLFLAWLQFGATGRERFVTAAPAEATSSPGLPIDGVAPRGGVLAATGLSVRPGFATDRIDEITDEALARWPETQAAMEDIADDDAELEPDTVRTIGTIVGDMFSRWPTDDPSKRTADPRVAPPLPDGVYIPPEAAVQAPPIVREPAQLQPYFVEVRRGRRITETLRVMAYDADHARAIVSDLPERPIIQRGPSLRLDW